MLNLLFVAFGGFIGSILRFFLSEMFHKHFVGTWIANITGSFILAITLHFYLTEQLSHSLWLFLGIGFCGAYTTFSTFSNETIKLILAKRYWSAFYYISASFAVSLTLVAIVLVWN